MKFRWSFIFIIPLIFIIVSCKEDKDSVSITPTGTGSWTVGSTQLTFKRAYAMWDNNEKMFSIHFVQDIGVIYPWITLTIDGESSLTIGKPYLCTIIISKDTSTTYLSGLETTDPKTSITFSKLELKNLGLASGNVSGQVKRFEGNNTESINVTGNFNDVSITFVQVKKMVLIK